MTKALSPADVARETLRVLAQMRKPPTPENYALAYRKIAGEKLDEDVPVVALKALLDGLPQQNPDQAQLVRTLQNAVASGSWDVLGKALTGFLERKSAHHHWPGLLRRTIRLLQLPHATLDQSAKAQQIDESLKLGVHSDIVYERMEALCEYWESLPAAPASQDATSAATESTPLFVVLRDLTAQLLESGIAMLLSAHGELRESALALALKVRNCDRPSRLQGLLDELPGFLRRLQVGSEQERELKIAHQQVVALIFENIRSLVTEDQWLSGQLTLVRDLLSEPLSLRRADDVERRMRDVVDTQSAMSQQLMHVKSQMKGLLATFVGQLGGMVEATSGYHDTIERCADRISQSTDPGELVALLGEALHETRRIQQSTAHSRDELESLRAQVAQSEGEIERLHLELAQASDKVRTDALTGALNRRGLDQQIPREVSRAERHGTSLCMALLDIDNFKQLNDELGHAAGDSALVHLATIVQQALRPVDTLARYGGEEFVILLPEILLDDAVHVMVRVQRELTRQIFLHDEKKILITFSCGVTLFAPDETPQQALQRADEAMYLAKRSGKNRVIAG